MQARPGSRCRLIVPHPEHAVSRLDLVTGAPPRDERARQRRFEEVDRRSVIEHPAHPRRRHGPSVSAPILIQPSGYLGITLTKPPGGTPILMRTGKRRSANVIMSRGISCSSSVLIDDRTAASSCPDNKSTTTTELKPPTVAR